MLADFYQTTWCHIPVTAGRTSNLTLSVNLLLLVVVECYVFWPLQESERQRQQIYLTVYLVTGCVWQCWYYPFQGEIPWHESNSGTLQFSSVPINSEWDGRAVRLPNAVRIKNDVLQRGRVVKFGQPSDPFCIPWIGTSSCRTACCGTRATTRLRHQHTTEHRRGTGSRRRS